VGAILEGEPRPITLLQPRTPPGLTRVIARCLRKDPDDRWESAHDVAGELRWIASSTVHDVAAANGPRSWPRALLIAAGLVLSAATLAFVLPLRQSRGHVEGATVRSTIELPDTALLATASGPSSVGRPALALAPDGAVLVYVGQHGTESRLYVRRLSDAEPAALAGTEGAYSPFFSSDGMWIGFFAAGRLKKVSTHGGDPVVLSEVRNPLGATWLSDGDVVIGDQEGTVLTRVRSDGSTDAAARWHGVVPGGAAWPQALPGDHDVLARDRDGNTVAVSLRTGEARVLVADATGAAYAPSGHLVFARDGALMAAPFDAATLQVTAAAVPVVSDVRTEASSEAAQVAVSAAGTLAFVKGGRALAQLTWVDRTARSEPVSVPPRAFGTFALSPDGRRVAAQVNGPGSDIWVIELARNAFMRLTTNGVSRAPLWTPDGTRVVYRVARPDAPGMYWQAWDGSAPAERLFDIGSGGAWSPDGRAFVYARPSPGGSLGLWLFRFGEADRGSTAPFLETAFTEWGPAWSPDGRWIAYTSDESGRYEVYVRSARSVGGKWQISTEGGEEPRWASGELIFRCGQQWLAAQVTSVGDRFVAGRPVTLFSGPFINPPGPSYDVTGDGRRLMVLAPVGDASGVRRVELVQGWFDELAVKAPIPRGR
jgi:hypothetical protein